jgi:hypothetical protein
MSDLKVEDFEKKITEMETEVTSEIPVAKEVTPEVVEEVKEELEPKEGEGVAEKVEPKVDENGNPIPEVKVEAYVPNTKYSVHNKEKEFDPIFKPIITSKEVEDKIRTLHAKADGLEAVQHARDNWKNQYEEVKKEVDTIITPARMLYQRGQEYIEKGDMESAIQCITGSMKNVYTEDEILAAANLIAETKLHPESKGKVERDLRFHQDSIAQSRERETIDSQRLELESREVAAELDYFFKQPEVVKVKEVYDRIHGDGSFFKKVGNYGHTMSLQMGKTYPAAKAIEDMVKEYAPFAQTQAQPVTASPQVKVQDKVVTPNNVDKIPNLRPTASVGKKSQVSSVADLDSRIAQMEKEI